MATRSERTADKSASAATQARLKALLKLPANKACAECKRNDPRWSAWNIGNFVCIRCSGVLRSMGTHIAKVKSVDLDVWTVEQVATVERWGNKRVNAYWEAHLKAGHIPPDHKIDSFIRSKYESRRWAMEGALPTDPAVLDQEGDAREREAILGTSSASASASASAATLALASAGSLGRPSSANQAVRSPGPSASAVDLFGDDTFTSTLTSNLEAKKQRAGAAVVGATRAGLLDLAPSHSAPVSTSASRSGSIATLAKPNKADILSLYGPSKSSSSTGLSTSPGLFDDFGSLSQAPSNDDLFASSPAPETKRTTALTSSLNGLSLENEWSEEMETPPLKVKGTGQAPKTLPLPPSLKMPMPSSAPGSTSQNGSALPPTSAPVPPPAPLPTYRLAHPGPPPPIQPSAFAATAMTTSSAFHGGLSPPKSTSSAVPKDFPTGFGSSTGFETHLPSARRRGDSLGMNAWSDDFDSFQAPEQAQAPPVSASTHFSPMASVQSSDTASAPKPTPTAFHPSLSSVSTKTAATTKPKANAGWDDFADDVWNAPTPAAVDVPSFSLGTDVASSSGPLDRKSSLGARNDLRNGFDGTASAATTTLEPAMSKATPALATPKATGWSGFDSSPWAEDEQPSKEARPTTTTATTTAFPVANATSSMGSARPKATTLEDIYADWS